MHSQNLEMQQTIGSESWTILQNENIMDRISGFIRSAVVKTQESKTSGLQPGVSDLLIVCQISRRYVGYGL